MAENDAAITPAPTPAPPAAETTAPAPAAPSAWTWIALQRRSQRGAMVIISIAGFSLLNVFVASSGWGMAFGLTSTSVIAAYMLAFGGTVELIGWATSLILASVFVIFGVLAYRNFRWAYLAAMILWGLDAIASIYFHDWFGVFFHAAALAYMVQGFRALQRIKKPAAA